MSSSVILDRLKQLIESQHGGSATFRDAWQVQNAAKKSGEWDGIVHVFDLKNHSQSNRAYAWASPIKGSNSMRFFAVLHAGRINGPVEAVKAAAAMIRAQGNAK